jgi:hypothetical protein
VHLESHQQDGRAVIDQDNRSVKVHCSRGEELANTRCSILSLSKTSVFISNDGQGSHVLCIGSRSCHNKLPVFRVFQVPLFLLHFFVSPFALSIFVLIGQLRSSPAVTALTDNRAQNQQQNIFARHALKSFVRQCHGS